CVVVYLHCRKR
ncbi:putative membrane protein, partial [Vibrio parahaemolyticus EKP-028]